MEIPIDVLIIGGGLVGGSLALALEHSGLSVALVESISDAERIAAPTGDRALALAWGSTQILDQVGVWPLVVDQAEPIRSIHVSDRGHFGKVRMHAEDLDVDALGYVATARDLEDAVARRLADSSIRRYCPARLLGAKAGSDHINVTLQQDGAQVHCDARLLIGADGGESTVRRLCGIEQSVNDYGQTAIVTEVATERNHRGVAYERFTRSGPLAFLPVAPKRCSVVWTVVGEDADELLALPEPSFRDRLQDTFGYWLGAVTLTRRRIGFPLRLVQARQMAGERVLLIGNAMHQLHPVAGQGFNLGLRDVGVLAERLGLRARAGEDVGAVAFLKAFEAARRQDLSTVIRFTDGMVRLFTSDFFPVIAGRNAGLLMLDHFTPAKRLLARYAMGLGARVPRFG